MLLVPAPVVVVVVLAPVMVLAPVVARVLVAPLAPVVRQLVVDSCVPNRAHRKDLFGGAYQAGGVACGPHADYGAMCVIDFAGAIVQR